MREYNVRIVYEYLNNPFQVDCSIPDLNLHPMPIDDSSISNKRSRYTPDLLAAVISVASGNYASTLTTPYDSPQVILLIFDAPDTDHTITREKPVCATEKRG